MTRSVVDNLGVDADPVPAEPPDDPAAAPEDEAEDVVLVPPAAVPAPPPDPPPLDILSELNLLTINMKGIKENKTTVYYSPFSLGGWRSKQ